MALKVKVNDQLLDSNNSSTVHLMPCKISHNGSANVSAYFTPYIQNQLKESSAAEPAERKGKEMITVILLNVAFSRLLMH